MSWLRSRHSGKAGPIVIKGEYSSGKKMANPDFPTKKDFLPKGILKNAVVDKVVIPLGALLDELTGEPLLDETTLDFLLDE